MVKIHANAMVSSLIANSPNTQVMPSNGSKTTATFNDVLYNTLCITTMAAKLSLSYVHFNVNFNIVTIDTLYYAMEI